MTKKITFTPAAIEALRSGKITDPQNPGLFVEATTTGKRVWKYRRRIAGGDVINMRLGLYSRVNTIAAAREWARGLNEAVEAGIDPRSKTGGLTVAEAHAVYMDAVARNQHKTTRRKSTRPLKPRTIADKLALYSRNIAPAIGSKLIDTIESRDLTKIVIGMIDKGSKVQANRVAAELNVFFAFCVGLRGQAAGINLATNPADVLAQLWSPEQHRTRWFDPDELPLFLKAVAAEDRLYRRAIMLLLLTGCRRGELCEALASEVENGVWTIPAERSKNHRAHRIELGPFGRKMIETNDRYIIQSPRLKRNGEVTGLACGWPKTMERVRARMAKLSGQEVDHFVPHDIRRTMRSHQSRAGNSPIVAEKMINHVSANLDPISGAATGATNKLERIYDQDSYAEEIAAGFARWEDYLAKVARKAGVAKALGLTKVVAPQSKPTPQIS